MIVYLNRNCEHSREQLSNSLNPADGVDSVNGAEFAVTADSADQGFIASVNGVKQMAKLYK